ncbi:DEAD/DEAH box helicase [Candidatus Omnitrophota bacterium]
MIKERSMLDTTFAAKFNLPAELVLLLQQSGIKKLYPFQNEALEKGLLKSKNLVLALPTASGKTLIAELCMVKSIVEHGKDTLCLYVVPLKALANEKFSEFKAKYEPLGIKVGIATGDFDLPSTYLSRYNILIATSEKVDSLLRFRAKWLTKLLSVIVLDEIHSINDDHRGPTLEILTARVKQLNPTLQILALSATIKNADEIAGWLDAELIFSNWRPIPLKEGVYYLNSIDFADGTSKEINPCGVDDIAALCLDTINEKGQCLVFVNSRRSTQAVARTIGKKIVALISSEERQRLFTLADKIEATVGEPTKICKQLAQVIRQGVAFHHAGLHSQQRKLVEEHFKNNSLKVICSTPTLAAGVNLPARRVIIRDYKRYRPGLGSVPVPVFEYKQCAGRAGRPTYDTFGESVVVVKTLSEYKTIFNEYINAAPEPITSKLNSENALRTHILSSIASGYVYDVNGMFDFLSHTFLAHQKNTQHLIVMVSNIFEFLEHHGLIKKKGFGFHPTAFGSCVSRLYIDPLSGIVLRNGLVSLTKSAQTSEVELLLAVCACTDMELLSVGQSDRDKLDIFSEINEVMSQLHDEPYEFLEYSQRLSIAKTVWMLTDWINEEKEEIICDHFNVGPGDIHRIIQTAQWLMYSAQSIAKLFSLKNILIPLDSLKQRVQYGIKEELLNLVLLRGIGRVRARSLYKKGFKKLRDIQDAEITELVKIPRIAHNLATSLKQQISKLEV